MFFWKSLAFSMIQQTLTIWTLVPLPLLNPAWTSGSSWFTYCWSLAWRILSMMTLLAGEMSAVVQKFEHSLALPFFGIGMTTDLIQSCGHYWVFQICWHTECSTFTASSFRIWNSSARIPSPPLALFIVMLPEAHLTSHSRMSDSRWVITPSWLSGLWRSSLYSSLCSCYLFLISSASVRSIPFLSLLVPIFAWNVSLVFLIFLKRSLVFSILLFSVSLHCSLRKSFLSLFAVFWNSAFRWVYPSYSPLTFTCLLFSGICKVSSDNHLAFLHVFFLGWFWSLPPVQCYELPSIVLQYMAHILRIIREYFVLAML